MKSLNAPLVSVSYDAIELAPHNRPRSRGHSRMASSSSIKREIRRKQRHFLGANLLKEAHQGLQELASGLFSQPKVTAPASEAPHLFLAPVGFGTDPRHIREVQVIRKGPMRRKTVSTLAVVCH